MVSSAVSTSWTIGLWDWKLGSFLSYTENRRPENRFFRKRWINTSSTRVSVSSVIVELSLAFSDESFWLQKTHFSTEFRMEQSKLMNESWQNKSMLLRLLLEKKGSYERARTNRSEIHKIKVIRTLTIPSQCLHRSPWAECSEWTPAAAES